MGEILRMEGICKKFPGVQALSNVDLNLNAGEVHCLVGENGAGKSTLIKILAGAYKKDEGKILLNGKEVDITNPHVGRMLGVSVIYQELGLVPSLNVAENIFLGNEIYHRTGTINWKKTKEEAKNLLNTLGIDFPVETLVRKLSVAHQQFVTTARALSVKSIILVMDEPSAVLSGKELDLLFETIKRLKKMGMGIIYISHRLAEVFEIGDRITILRDGNKVHEAKVSEIDMDQVVKHMVGREIKEYFFKEKFSFGENVLTIKNLQRAGVLHDINFQLRKGEILGISGLVGAGRTELARAIAGIDAVDKGEILLKGQKVRIRSPLEALNLGIGSIPEDRKKYGLLLERSVEENVSLPILHRFSKFGIIKFKKLFETVKYYIDYLRIRTPSFSQLANNLSGGNQQKLVLAKWLASKCEILIMDEPTRGVDVGAKVEIYHLMNDIVKGGGAIVFISSELPEVLSMSDRILVMCEGRITKELIPKETTQEEILQYSLPQSKRVRDG
jgi:ribose transport system ATP-binding protein